MGGRGIVFVYFDVYVGYLDGCGVVGVVVDYCGYLFVVL